MFFDLPWLAVYIFLTWQDIFSALGGTFVLSPSYNHLFRSWDVFSLAVVSAVKFYIQLLYDPIFQFSLFDPLR